MNISSCIAESLLLTRCFRLLSEHTRPGTLGHRVRIVRQTNHTTMNEQEIPVTIRLAKIRERIFLAGEDQNSLLHADILLPRTNRRIS